MTTTRTAAEALEEVLPCPCCGYRAAIEQVPPEIDDANAGGYYIECKRAGCGITTRLAFALKDDPIPSLIKSWNQRAALAPPQEGEPTITVSGPVACGKSFVMELIYKALRDAGLHPYSDDLAHERRMVEEQPQPPAKVWKLREAVYAAPPQAAPAQEPVATLEAKVSTLLARALTTGYGSTEAIYALANLAREPLFAAPPPPAPAQEPVDVAASSIRNGSTNKGDKMINYTGRHKDSFDRFFASTQKEKPVGWRKDLNPPHGNFTLQWLEENPWPEQNHVQPLYAAPPPDEARELLEELSRRTAMMGDMADRAVHERIRAYLEKHK